MHTVRHIPAYEGKLFDRTTAGHRQVTHPETWDVVFLTAAGSHEIETFGNKADAYALCNYLNGGQAPINERT